MGQLPALRFSPTARNAWVQCLHVLGGLVVTVRLIDGSTLVGELLGDGKHGSMVKLHPLGDDLRVNTDSVQVVMTSSIESIYVV